MCYNAAATAKPPPLPPPTRQRLLQRTITVSAAAAARSSRSNFCTTTEWFDHEKHARGMASTQTLKRHDSYVGHALLCRMLLEQLGMTFLKHEELMILPGTGLMYQPDLGFSWTPAGHHKPITLYCDVKCVDSERQARDNYRAVQKQCESGQSKMAEQQPRPCQKRLLFVGFVVKDSATLEFACCLGKHHRLFEQLMEGRVDKTRKYYSAVDGSE